MPQPVYQYLEANGPEVEGEDGEASEVNIASKSPEVSSYSIIKWVGGRKKVPLVSFSPQVLLLGLQPEERQLAERYHLAYKFVKTECKLVRSILNSHCFREVHPNSPNFNLMWTGSHPKPHTLRGMQDFQKINHFPRSYELTRKDRLYKNIQRMQHQKGYKHFDFIPNSYVLPEEYNEFYSAFMKDKGPWIVKPVASSRGRGIYLVNHPSQVPLDENLLICKYIANPLLIDGFKFDVRLYVGVTCYDPIRVYLYEEGLARFATVKYEKSTRNIGNTCMHLTNYSVNKKSENFVSCQDPEVEDYGNKWSMSAMLRYLKENDKDTTALMMRIEDIVIKTIIAGELPVASACKMFMPHPGNCFEIYGFDILIDERLRPWLLEVNLSPSLACEAPLDLKIKSHLITDMFNLIGYIAHDPCVRRQPYGRRVPDFPQRSKYQRTMSAGPVLNGALRGTSNTKRKTDEDLTLTAEEARILRQTNEENERRGGFVRIFPSSESWELYGSLLEHRTTHNQMLHSKLFPGKKASLHRPTTASLSSATARARTLTTYGHQQSVVTDQSQPSIAGQKELSITTRILCYERKLDSWSPSILRAKSKESLDPGKNSGLPESFDEIQVKQSKSSDEIVKPTLDMNVEQQLRQQLQQQQQQLLQQQQQLKLQDHQSQQQTHEKAERPMVETSANPLPKTLPMSAADSTRSSRSQGTQETVSKRVLSSQPRFKAVRVDDVIAKSGSLTKLQARQAFAMYLQRVQQRLIHEANYDSEDSSESGKQDEQMTLVIRFLKKAACNLQQQFKVVIPSRKLALHDRRRILAKQLGDFVHVYGKETFQLQKRLEITRAYGLSKKEDDGEIPDDDFKTFMAIASEMELEDLLTRYTKLNKSASVFLGGPPEKQRENENKISTSYIDTGLNRKKEAESSLRGHIRSASAAQMDSNWSSQRDSDMSDRRARYISAVTTYGKSVAINKTKTRPASAKPASSSSSGFDRTARADRPVSAKISRERVSDLLDSKNKETEERQAVANEEAVALALKRLAKRQSARKYSPQTLTSKASTNWRDILRQLYSDGNPEGPPHDGYVSLVNQESREHNVHNSPKSHDRHASANATFNSFVDYNPDDSDVTSLGDVETAMRQHAHPSTWRSIRVDLPREHEGTDQEEKSEPLEFKKPISRDDYNRHIRLLSQKLASNNFPFDNNTQVVPRPPPGPSPGRKQISAKRIARVSSNS